MFFFKPKRNSKFHTGETVRIKFRDEIIKSLDDAQKSLDGCLFTEQMWDYCGYKYKVLKEVKAIFNEHRQRTYKTKSNLYILENLICNGRTSDFPHHCDHCCFLLWHEEWLEKIQ
jgi:hypothetical protein